MLIYHAISIILLSLIILIIGMFKPKWILFWLDAPSRFAISVISIVVFMIGMTMYGEGNRQKKLELEKAKTATETPTVVEKPEPAKTVQPSAPVNAEQSAQDLLNQEPVPATPAPAAHP